MTRKKIQSMVPSSFVAPDFFGQRCLRSAATAARALGARAGDEHVVGGHPAALTPWSNVRTCPPAAAAAATAIRFWPPPAALTPIKQSPRMPGPGCEAAG